MAGSACSPIDYASMMLVVLELFIVPYHKFFCAPVRACGMQQHGTKTKPKNFLQIPSQHKHILSFAFIEQ